MSSLPLLSSVRVPSPLIQLRPRSRRLWSDKPTSRPHNTVPKNGIEQLVRSLLLSHSVVSSCKYRQYLGETIHLESLDSVTACSRRVTMLVKVTTPPSDAPFVVAYSRDQPQVVECTPAICKGKLGSGGFDRPGTHNVLPPIHCLRRY